MKNYNRPGITIEKLEKFFNENPRLQKPSLVILMIAFVLAILFMAIFIKH